MEADWRDRKQSRCIRGHGEERAYEGGEIVYRSTPFKFFKSIHQIVCVSANNEKWRQGVKLDFHLDKG